MRSAFFVVLFFVGCGPETSGPVIHGCDDASYFARTGASDDRRIGFGTALGSGAVGYAPKCLTIAAGQSVTFVGDFSTHPLVPGEYAGDAGTPGNPIPSQRSGSVDLSVTFSSAGYFPYYCDLHAPTMVGVVHVQ